MNREELTALRDAIDVTLALPDSIRELLAQWLAPEAARPNGHDARPLCPRRRPRPPQRRAQPPRGPTRPSGTTIPPTRGAPSGSFSRRCASIRALALLRWRRLSAQACRPPKRG